MKINKELLEKFRDINSNSKILAVTKYLETKDSIEVLKLLENEYSDIFEWIGENRLEKLKDKNLPRENTHFIWNLQTKDIKNILDYVDTIHSVDNLKQIKKIEEICAKKWTWVKIFIQINVDKSKEWWIKVEEIPSFLSLIWELENVSLLGFSAIWKENFSLEEKVEEFKLLIDLRNKYIPNWLVSAGTSLDYEIALEMWIDIIRIGRALYK